MDKKKKQERETFLLFSLGENKRKKSPFEKAAPCFSYSVGLIRQPG